MNKSLEAENEVRLFVTALLPNDWTVEKCTEGMVQNGVINVTCRFFGAIVDVAFDRRELEGKTEFQKLRFIRDRLASAGIEFPELKFLFA